jgi:hypothetical protein
MSGFLKTGFCVDLTALNAKQARPPTMASRLTVGLLEGIRDEG